MTTDSLQHLRTEESILFLGSGFSRNATNLRGQKIPLSNELKQELARQLEVNPELHDFQTLAEEINSKNSYDLYQILYELFTVRDLHEDQTAVLNHSWRRIYTTNYDDALESYYHESQKDIKSFTYRDIKPKKLPYGSIIHLHGMIRHAKEDNLLDQLILTESSYIRQHFEKSIWYDDFIRDLRFCQSCIFIGYSLRDYHISSILLQHTETAKKTFFIAGRNPDTLFSNRIAPYGHLLPIDLEEFSAFCRTLSPPTENARSIHDLRSFRYLDPLKDKKSVSAPTAMEILNLVTYGTFNSQRCLSTLPNSEYVVARRTLAQEAATLLDRSRTLILHSLIGNGKSIFLHILAHKLAERGFRCVLAKSHVQLLSEDVEILSKLSGVVLMFDSYNSAMDIIEEVIERLPEAKIVVAVRTGIQDVRLHEIQQRFPGPIQRVNLNSVEKEELREFRGLLDRFGIRSDDLDEGIQKCKDFREVVTTLYDHSEIKAKVATELKPLMDDLEVRKVLVASHLLRWIGHEVDAAFLRSVTGCDAYAVVGRYRATAADIFRLDHDHIQVRSPVFSEYVIQSHLATRDILDGVFAIIVEAVKRKGERRYQGILSSLMRFSMLDQAVSSDPQRIELLIGLYERLRRDVDVNREPLFWLQYSILMTAGDDLRMAEELIRTAYARARESAGFRTFQIDTFALRLMLLIEQRDPEGAVVKRFDQIVEKMEEVRRMIGEESRRDHAVQVLLEIEPFVKARRGALSVTERTSLVYHLALVQEELSGVTDADRARTGANSVWASLDRARGMVVNGPSA